MRNDNRKWTSPVGFDLATGLSVREIKGSRQFLVSGVDVQRRYASNLITWPDVVVSDNCALSLRRDQVLLVNGPHLPHGYNASTGLAATDMSSGLVILELSGPDAWTVLKRGAEIRLDTPSRSVARRVFGIDVMLYGYRDATCFRMHVPRAMAVALHQHVRAEL
ncbi:MAG: hypothetical protein AB3N13_03105 [Arenibacterium sp.]